MRYDLTTCVFGNAAGLAKTLEQANALAESKRSNRRTSGTFTLDEMSGNDGVVYYYDPRTRSAYNAIGFKNPGIRAAAKWLPEYYRQCKDDGVECAISLAALRPSDLAEAVGRSIEYCDRIELDLSYSNVWLDNERRTIISYYPETMAEYLGTVLPEVRGRRVSVKIAPVADALCEPLAEVLWRSGFVDEIVATNSLANQRAKRPDDSEALMFRESEDAEWKHSGALSGALLHQESLRVAALMRRLLPEHMGLVGCGGIESGRTLINFLDVGCGGGVMHTVLREEGIAAADRIYDEAEELLANEK